MKAVVLHTFGGPDVLSVSNVPDPLPIPGRAVIRVVAATVNPTDVLLRSGQQAASMSELSPPYIPGMEFAGHVLAVGNGSTTLKIGQPVMGIVDPRRPEGGAQSEMLSISLNSLVPLDRSVDLAEAATIPMNGLTALKAIGALGLRAGEAVLVTGGAGGLGGYVVQLAKHAGLHVIADAHEADQELLQRLGADQLVPRGAGMAEAVRELVPDGVDGVVDAAVLGESARSPVRNGGICVAVRAVKGAQDARVRLHTVSVTAHAEDSTALSELGKLFAEGVLTPRIAARLPVGKAAKAHRLLEAGGLRGRIVLMF